MLPTTAMREIVMIPQEHIGWLVNQKDDVLSVKETRNGNMALDSLLPNLMELPHGGFRYDVLRREFPRYLDVLQPIVMEELSKATETSLGLDIDGWHEVCLWQSMRKIIKPVANRLFYDYPLCEDPGFEKSTESFFSWVGIGGFVAGKLVPWPLRRFLGSLFAIPVYFHLKMSLRKLLPTVKKRVDDIKRGAHDHNSFLTLWVTAFLNANVNESVKNPQVIAERLLLMVSKVNPSMTWSNRSRPLQRISPWSCPVSTSFWIYWALSLVTDTLSSYVKRHSRFFNRKRTGWTTLQWQNCFLLTVLSAKVYVGAPLSPKAYWEK